MLKGLPNFIGMSNIKKKLFYVQIIEEEQTSKILTSIDIKEKLSYKNLIIFLRTILFLFQEFSLHFQWSHSKTGKI